MAQADIPMRLYRRARIWRLLVVMEPQAQWETRLFRWHMGEAVRIVLAIVAATLLWEASAANFVAHYAAETFGAGNFALITSALR
jgi:hypothetical protein